MNDLFSRQRVEHVKGVAIVVQREGGLLLDRTRRGLDLIKGLVLVGEDAETAATRVFEERTGEILDPVRLPHSVTDMSEQPPVEYQLVGGTSVEGAFDGVSEEGPGYYDSIRLRTLIAAGVGVTAVLGAVLGTRIIQSRHRSE